MSRLLLPPLVALLAASLAPPAATAAKPDVEIRHPEDLFIVDCLLPSRVRNLGRNMKFAAPRQVIRTSAHDCALRGGEYTVDPARNDFALQAWTAQAEGGDAEAANNVGEIYEQGVRGLPDLVQAAAWYRRAAEGGSRRAQRNLAHCYETGAGVEADAVQAIVWYRKAAGLAGATDLDLEKEVAALRAEVARLTDEAARARAELERSVEELASARLELTRAEGELEATEAELRTAEGRLTQAERERRAAERALAAEKIAAEARARDAGEAKGAASGESKATTSSSTPPDPATASAARLAEKQREVAANRERVANLEAAQDRYRRLASELESSASAAKELAARGREAVIAKRAPAIEFFRPDVLATRGPALVPVPGGAREVEVVGKVTAELGLAEFTAAGKVHEIGADGIFRLRLPVEPNRPVPFVAVDRAARRTEAELVFVSAASAPPAVVTATTAPAEKGRRYHALVLAGAAYQNMAPLATALADGESFASLLRDRFGFEVTWAPNVTFLEAMRRLTELATRLGPSDDLVVYFAGHGRIDAATGRGYWLPVDADPNDSTTWIPNEALAKIFGTMRAGRVLVVADSCYAGTLAGLGLERTANAGPGRRVRSVLSSGGLAPVLDEGAGKHSIFARALLTVLSLAREPLSADRLYQAVAARVAFRSSELGIAQRPEYAPLGFAGHEGGDFVFQPKS